jgi:hypothetical protein
VLVLKDVKEKNLFVRRQLGLWLIRKEWSIYSRWMGVRDIPRVIERIGGGILRLKHRVASSMTPQELKTLKRLNRLRKFWIFN